MLSRHSIVSSSRTARPCSPWGGRWIGHWRTTWSTVCSSAPHYQVAEGPGGHTPFLQAGVETSDTGAEAVKPDPGSSWEGHSDEVSAGVGDKCAESCKVVRPVRRTYIWLSDKLMSCAAGTRRCLDLRRRAIALDGRVSAEWSRCPGSMARCHRGSLAPLRWRSAGWMPARIGRLSAGVGVRCTILSQFAMRHWWRGQ